MKQKMKKVIAGNLPLVLIVFFAFVIMVLVSYFYVSNIIERQMLKIGEETMNTTETSVSARLSEAELIFSTIILEVKDRLISGESNQEILQYLIKTNDSFESEYLSMPDFMMIYAFIRDEMLSGSGAVPPDGYIAQERPWYIGAVENGEKIYFSDPYIDADTGSVIISFSQEILDNDGNSYGVAAIDFNLDRISEYVTKQEISNNGYGVMVDYNMSFTAHRDNSLLGTKMREAGSGYKKLASLLSNQNSISAVRFTDVDGTDSVAFFRSIFHGWYIGIIIPRAKYFEQAHQLSIVLGSLGLILTLILSCLLVRFHNEKMRSEEESRSKSSFLARMSHEMRTPLNAIIGMINITKKSQNMNEVQTNIDKINDSANHLLGVINDVLDMSKIAAGKMELSDTEFWFQDVINQVIAVMKLKFDEKHQIFTVHIDQNVPKSIVADKQRLAQVITNLLSNANKFALENGNISLTVCKTESNDKKCKLQIEVTDDGIGISEEQKARLFHSFEQADNTISRKYGGTGLGLAISKKIVNMMDGEIWIESKPEKGSKFIFTANVGIGTLDETKYQEKVSSSINNITNIFTGKHILLAEDVEINREILIELLKDTGVTIDCAENGHEVCEKFINNPELYDMIFMDVHMPEMDGYEATKIIREKKTAKAQSIPIIAMTANVFQEDIEKCLSIGMNNHIGKPLDINIVIDKMKQYLL